MSKTCIICGQVAGSAEQRPLCEVLLIIDLSLVYGRFCTIHGAKTLAFGHRYSLDGCIQASSVTCQYIYTTQALEITGEKQCRMNKKSSH